MKELLRRLVVMLNGYCHCGKPYPCLDHGSGT